MALEFILERYNYWIVIILMMTGLYIVFSRGNLVKKVVGLNLFQTSVFIFYITIGKIVGGTAPILIGGHGDEHGDTHKGADGAVAAGAGHDTAAADLSGQDGSSANPVIDLNATLSDQGGGLHDKIANPAIEMKPNDLSVSPPVGGDAEAGAAPSLHVEPGKISNSFMDEAKTAFELNPSPDSAGAGHADAASQIADAAGHGVNAVTDAAAIIYTNPLPHVLILTAIVVGVATTAVGLALAVRVREAYGTIEEDELEAADHIAEFGVPAEGQA